MSTRLLAHPLLVNLLSFFFLSLLAFRDNSRLLFHGLDGRFEVSVITQLSLFSPPLLAYSNDFIHGLGNVWFTVNPWFIPAYFLSLSEPGVFTNFALAYAICAAELFAGTYLLARLIGMPRIVGLLAAWALTLLAFQYAGWNKIPNTFRAFPHYATIAVISTLMAASLLWLNQAAKWRSVGIACLVFLGVTYILIVAPTLLILAAPQLAVFGIFSLCAAGDRRDLLFRMGSMAGVLVACIVSGHVHFLLGLLTYTAANSFTELAVRHVGLQEVSLLFWNQFLPVSMSSLLRIERVFVGLGLIGGLWTAARGKGVKRSAAIAFLATASLYILVGLLHSYRYFWFGPAFWYFEGFLLPYHAIFAAFLVTDLSRIVFTAGGRALRIVGSDPAKWSHGPALLLPWIIAVAPWPYIRYEQRSEPPDLPFFAPHPQAETAITRILKDEVSLSPGTAFRGRVAGLTGRIFPPSTDVGSLTLWHTSNVLALHATGNSHDAAGLWQDSVPTLLEINQLITPAYFAFTRTFFTEPADNQIRQAVAMRRIDPRLLASVGVRFVITDAPFEGLKLRETVPVPVSPEYLKRTAFPQDIHSFTLFLYELDGVNIGQFSPTDTRVTATAAETIDALADPAVDLSRTVMASEPLPKGLAPATLQEFLVERGRFRVRATSSGRSVLLLPMEFSRCLRVRSNVPHAPEVRLFRADLLLTGVLFDRTLDATISYRTGPFVNSGCRLKDRADVAEMKIKDVFAHRPQLAPKGMFVQ
jgi:hypothetical protein